MVLSKALGGEDRQNGENSGSGSERSHLLRSVLSSRPVSTLNPPTARSPSSFPSFPGEGSLGRHWKQPCEGSWGLRFVGTGMVRSCGLCSWCRTGTSCQVAPARGLLLGPALQCLGSWWLWKGGRKTEAWAWSHDPSPFPQALARALTSALGTFLFDLTLLGALSPTSSSEVSGRASAWLVLGLALGAGSSPGWGRKGEPGSGGCRLASLPWCPTSSPRPCQYLSPQ